MKRKLIDEYHSLIEELMEFDETKEWENIIEREGYNYDSALFVLYIKLANLVYLERYNEAGNDEVFDFYLQAVDSLENIIKRNKRFIFF